MSQRSFAQLTEVPSELCTDIKRIGSGSPSEFGACLLQLRLRDRRETQDPVCPPSCHGKELARPVIDRYDEEAEIDQDDAAHEEGPHAWTGTREGQGATVGRASCAAPCRRASRRCSGRASLRHAGAGGLRNRARRGRRHKGNQHLDLRVTRRRITERENARVAGCRLRRGGRAGVTGCVGSGRVSCTVFGWTRDEV